MSYTVDQCQTMLDSYIAAEASVLKNQSYTIADVTYTRQDLAKIRAGRKEWFANLQYAKTKSSGGARNSLVRFGEI